MFLSFCPCERSACHACHACHERSVVKRSVVKRSACPERSVGVVEAIASRAKKVGLEIASSLRSSQ